VQARLDQRPDAMIVRRSTVEHPFGTIKAWMGAMHFKMKTLRNVATEMALHVLANNIKRVIAILGVPTLIEAIRASCLFSRRRCASQARPAPWGRRYMRSERQISRSGSDQLGRQRAR
jgi:hypothetical protein